MEMTGLDVEKEAPIEVAAIVTDWHFKNLASYHAVIRQSPALLAEMDDWNQKHHKASGLLDLIPGGQDLAVVDQELTELITREFGGEKAILCGNSISQDRLFIRKYMPKTEAALHYRMLDVTSWKVVFNNLYDLKFKKTDGHRALDDIKESIAEMQFYLGHLKMPLKV